MHSGIKLMHAIKILKICYALKAMQWSRKIIYTYFQWHTDVCFQKHTGTKGESTMLTRQINHLHIFTFEICFQVDFGLSIKCSSTISVPLLIYHVQIWLFDQVCTLVFNYISVSPAILFWKKLRIYFISTIKGFQRKNLEYKFSFVTFKVKEMVLSILHITIHSWCNS